MKITKLEIVGFKSFGDRSKLLFGEGITGVVGPNGCGKSNIVDAIRWCMGEMSAKHLRGKAMQDVIFNGAHGRSPMGMAEVTLTFSNDGDFPVQYANMSELSITRRLHRDGESEYLINKVDVRLKDIVDLFLGTGVGTRAYSIIEQGRIGFVLNSKPEERRRLIEEVAGITKFKARKEAAERRMQSTEQNLLRVNDIVSELDKQLTTLRRQAKKAERFRELNQELRDLELHSAAIEMLRLLVLEKSFQQTLHEVTQALADQERDGVILESELEAMRLQFMQQEDDLQTEQQISAEADAKLAALERDLEHYKRELTQISLRAKTAKDEVEEVQKRLQELDHELVLLNEQTTALQTELTQEQQSLKSAEHLVLEQRDDLNLLDDDLKSMQHEAVKSLQQQMQAQADLRHLQQKRESIEEKEDAALKEKENLTEQLAQVKTKYEKFSHDKGQIKTEVESIEQNLLSNKQQHQLATADVAAKTQTFEQHKSALTKAQSRLTSLEEIANKFEGFSDGVRKLLGDKKQQFQGLFGLVTDILQVPKEYEQAIEAVLAERLQYIVTSDEQAALAALEYLQQQGGRSGFVFLQTPLQTPAQSQDGLIGIASHLVKYDPQYQNVVHYLLGQVGIVEDLKTAQTLNATYTLVTLQGDIYLSNIGMVGGKEQGTGLLAQRREIRELSTKVKTLNVETPKIQSELEEAKNTQTYLEATQKTLEQQLQQQKLSLLAIEKDCEAVHRDLTRFEERVQNLTSIIVQCQEAFINIDNDTEIKEQAIKTAETQKQTFETEQATLQERRQMGANLLQKSTETLTGHKIKVAASEQKLNAVKESTERLQKTKHEYEQRLKRDEQAISQGHSLAAELSLRTEQGEQEAKNLAELGQKRHQALQQARALYEQKRLEISNFEQRLKESRKQGDSVGQKLTNIKIELQKIELESTHLVQQTYERHDVDVKTLISDYHLRPLPSEKDKQRRIELDRSIKAMGSINLAAIEECAQVETRYQFLLAQRDDLNNALKALQEAIVQINKKSRERFKEAFDAVNTMFQKVFPRLFRGGEARLELTSNDDLLEAGVEMIAMPPGKKLQNVTLLSGGEKALTATALIFSIFLIKPSPFCILDEVDAPLDEANVLRFNEMLREISQFSQFIVITHNKQTMCVADRIYGITMEDAGLSKVVAVDLQGLSASAA